MEHWSTYLLDFWWGSKCNVYCLFYNWWLCTVFMGWSTLDCIVAEMCCTNKRDKWLVWHFLCKYMCASLLSCQTVLQFCKEKNRNLMKSYLKLYLFADRQSCTKHTNPFGFSCSLSYSLVFEKKNRSDACLHFELFFNRNYGINIKCKHII